MRRQLLLVVLVLAACERARGPRVTLQPPPPGAPLEDRRQAFTRLKGDGMKIEKAPILSNAADREYLRLADGTKVFAVDDLMPVVRESTETGKALQRLQRARNKRTLGQIIGIGGGMIGAGLLIGGITMIARSDDPNPVGPHSKPGGIALTIVGGAILVGGVGYGLTSFIDGGEQTTKATKIAFDRYTDSLAETLRICTKGIELVDCDAGH